MSMEIDEIKQLLAFETAIARHDAETELKCLKSDIRDSLKSSYDDFNESKELPMTEVLGNIYKAKLLDIYAVLEREGIL